MTVFPGKLDQNLDVQGSLTKTQTRTLTDENASKGVQQSTGTGDSFAKVGNVITLTDAGASWTDADKGRFITINTPVTTPGNAGTFMITAVGGGGTTVDYTNAAGAAEAYTGVWEVNDPYSLLDDLDFERTDRKLIKGTANYYSDVPTYVRPSAIGTNVPANLTNIAGKTTDAKAIVRDVKQTSVKLRPGITGADGNLLTGDETFSTTNYHFTADDLNSFITISGGTAADGTYRIKTVTDGKTLELDGLNNDADETCSWELISSQKGILSSRGWADATDRIGIPIADSGAEDETVYEATFVDLIDPLWEARPTKNNETPIWARSYGDELDPKKTVTNEGVRFFAQLKTGLNDGTATTSTLEFLSGRSGSAASVTNASKTITGLTGMTQEDIGRWITVYNNGADANCGHFKIATVAANGLSVTVTKTANFVTDANDGSIKWAISKHPGTWDFYNGDRYRLDQMSETALRTTLIGGIISDAELEQAIADLREFTGADPAQTTPTLTNTGNYFVWSDLPSTSNTNLEELCNVLNEQIGDRDYDAPGNEIIADGETITASLQKLADAIMASNIVRTIDRRTSQISKFTVYNIPVTYTLDGTGNGRNMFVFWRGTLRDPGSVGNGDDYAETSTTSITPFTDIKVGDHVNFLVLQ